MALSGLFYTTARNASALYNWKSKFIRSTVDHAIRNNRKKVTAVHKANIMKLGDGLFMKSCQEISKLYPKVEFETIVVMPNSYGNIINNFASSLRGGAGIVPNRKVFLTVPNAPCRFFSTKSQEFKEVKSQESKEVKNKPLEKSANSFLFFSSQCCYVNVRCLHVQSVLRALNEGMTVDFTEEPKQGKLQYSLKLKDEIIEKLEKKLENQLIEIGTLRTQLFACIDSIKEEIKEVIEDKLEKEEEWLEKMLEKERILQKEKDEKEKKDQQITQLRMEMGLRSSLVDFINLICPDWIHLTTLSRRQKLRTSLEFGLTIFAQKIGSALWKKGYDVNTLVDGIVRLYGEESDRHHERIILPKFDEPEFDELCEKLKINDRNKVCLKFILSEMQSSNKASFSGMKKALIWVHLSNLIPQLKRDASLDQIEQAIMKGIFGSYAEEITSTLPFIDDKQKFEGTVTIMLQNVRFSDTAKIRDILNGEKSTYTHMTYDVKFHEIK